MNLTQMVERIKAHPDYPGVGMILCHNGVVRQASREGRAVTGLRVSVDHDILDRIIRENKARSGIIEILVHIFENRDLAVGDDVMYIVVAGDIRETVLAVLTDCLNQIKSQATSKEQFFVDAG